MYKHILVPVDGSTASMAALDKAAGVARAYAVPVTAIFVIDPYPFTGVGADFAYAVIRQLESPELLMLEMA